FPLVEDGVALILELGRTFAARFIGPGGRGKREDESEGETGAFHKRAGFRGSGGLALEEGAALAEGFALGFTAGAWIGFAADVAIGVGSFAVAVSTAGTSAVGAIGAGSTASMRAGWLTAVTRWNRDEAIRRPATAHIAPTIAMP